MHSHALRLVVPALATAFGCNLFGSAPRNRGDEPPASTSTVAPTGPTTLEVSAGSPAPAPTAEGAKEPGSTLVAEHQAGLAAPEPPPAPVVEQSAGAHADHPSGPVAAPQHSAGARGTLELSMGKPALPSGAQGASRAKADSGAVRTDAKATGAAVHGSLADIGKTEGSIFERSAGAGPPH
jgi:hypothetical protein